MDIFFQMSSEMLMCIHVRQSIWQLCLISHISVVVFSNETGGTLQHPSTQISLLFLVSSQHISVVYQINLS